MTNTKILSAVEIQNRLELHRLHKALEGDNLTTVDIEGMCSVMYKMGLSPLTTVRKYLGKYNLKTSVLFIDANNTALCDITKRLKPEVPTLIIYMKEADDGSISNVAIRYYPALRNVDKCIYSHIQFTSVMLK